MFLIQLTIHVSDFIQGVRYNILESALDIVYNEIDSRLDASRPKCQVLVYNGSSIFCDSMIVGRLSQVIFSGLEGLHNVPRSAFDLSGSLKHLVSPLFSRFSSIGLPGDVPFNGHVLVCLGAVTHLFEDGEAWLQSQLSEMMNDFPTEEHKEYMARQRERMGVELY